MLDDVVLDGQGVTGCRTGKLVHKSTVGVNTEVDLDEVYNENSITQFNFVRLAPPAHNPQSPFLLTFRHKKKGEIDDDAGTLTSPHSWNGRTRHCGLPKCRT